MHLNVIGTRVEVVEDLVTMLREGTYGTYEWPIGGNPRIFVARLESTQDWVTLFHETLHALSDVLHLDLTEEQVRGLEVGIPSLFRDNPGLWEAMNHAD